MNNKTNTKNNFYLSLELLRGLCALEVVLWHCFARIDDVFLRISPTFKFVYHAFLRGSDIAIIGFFVLSGFVTTASFIKYFNKYNIAKAVTIFYAARMLRIWSLTFITVLVSVGISWHYRTMSGNWSAWEKYDHFDLSNIIGGMFGLNPHWNAPMWTLTYELAFYSILPFFMLAILRTNYLIKAISLVITGFLTFFLLKSEIVPLPHLVTPFLFGIAIYFIRDLSYLRIFFTSNLNKILFFAVAVTSVIYVSWEYLPQNPYNIKKYFLVTLVVLGLVFSESFFIKYKETKVIKMLTGLSMCSYSLYLWHYVILWFTGMYMFGSMNARSTTEIFVLFSIAVPTIILVTWMSWYFIERNAKMKRILPLFEKKSAKS
ncbi:MAG: acyltransferase [Rickettsiales bacterium]